MASNAAGTGPAKSDDGVKFTITVNCCVGGEKRAVSYTVFKRTLMSQVFDSSVQFFKLDPSQVILVVKNKVALTHKCVEDYRLSDKSVLDLIHVKEAPTIDLILRDQAGSSKTLTASTYHPLSDVVKAFCKHLGEETGFSDLYHGGIALDLDASPASIGLKTGEQLFCYCYKAACKQHWVSVGKPEQAKSLRFIKFYFSDWKYGYKTFPIFRHDISTPMEVLIRTFCAWRGLDYDQTGFLYSYTYKQVQQGDTATNKALADGDTILAYSRQELQGRLWDAILGGSCTQVLGLLDQGAELSTSIGPEEWGKHPLHAAVANGHVDLVKLLLAGPGMHGSVAGAGAEAVSGMAAGRGPQGTEGSRAGSGLHSQPEADEDESSSTSSGSSGSSTGGCDPNQLDYASDPPLWHAVENNLVELVELLLAAGATAADLPPREGVARVKTAYSACPHAARKGHAETLRVLLAAGANPWLPDADGYTAYDYAIDHAKPPAVVAALLEGDARFASMQRGFQAAYQRMCQMLKRTQRYPALGCPCRTCNSLLEIRAPETEASRQVREQIGCVALVRAVQAGGPHCCEVMELLLKAGALLDGQDYDGRTALHQAIRYNRLAEAAWLTGKGAHLDIPDFEGLLPLHQAGCSGFCDITRLLVAAGAPLNLHTIKYVSQEALDGAARKQAEGGLGSKKAKRKQQLDVSGLTTIGGNSPLALAIRHGHGAIVEYLLQQNAVFDLKNAADSSAFHAALDKGSAAIAGLLLQHINRKATAASGTGNGNGGGSGGGGGAAGSLSSGAGAGNGKGSSKALAVKEKEGRGKKDARKDSSRDQREREKDRERESAAKGGEAAGGGGGGGAAGDGGSAPPAEPPVAFDAGAGLREMVLKERERLRQRLGLSTPSNSGGSPSASSNSSGPAEAKPVLPIFTRNGTTPLSSSSVSAARAALVAPPAPAPPLPPAQPAAQPPPATAKADVGDASGNGAAGIGSVVPGGSGKAGTECSSCCSSAHAAARDSQPGSSTVTPASSSSTSPKVLTDEEGQPPTAAGQRPEGQLREQGKGQEARSLASAGEGLAAALPASAPPKAVDGASLAASASAVSAGRGPTPGPSPAAVPAPKGPAVAASAAASGRAAVNSTPAEKARAATPPAPSLASAPSAATADAESAKVQQGKTAGASFGELQPAAVKPSSAVPPPAAPVPPAATKPGNKLFAKPSQPTAAVQPAKGVSKPSSVTAASADTGDKAAAAAVPSALPPPQPATPALGATVASPIKVKFRAKPVESPPPLPSLGPALAVEPPSATGASTPSFAAAAIPTQASAAIDGPAASAFIRTRRGKVVPVPSQNTSGKYRGAAGQHGADSAQQPAGQAGSAGSAAAADPAAPHRPAHGHTGSSGNGAPQQHQQQAGRQHGTAPPSAGAPGRTSAPSTLRPAAPSYSPRGMVHQPHSQQHHSTHHQQHAHPHQAHNTQQHHAAAPHLPPPPPPGPHNAGPYGMHSHGSQQHPRSHMHAQSQGHSQAPAHPHAQSPSQPPVPPPPPGFAPRSGAAPLAGRPPPPPPPLTAVALHGGAEAEAAALARDDILDRHLESSLESMVLSVVDQGLEEGVGAAGLGDGLLLPSNRPQPSSLWGQTGGLGLRGGGPHSHALLMHPSGLGADAPGGIGLAEMGPGGAGGSFTGLSAARASSGELSLAGTGLKERSGSLARGPAAAGGGSSAADIAIAAAGAILDSGDHALPGDGGAGRLSRTASQQALSRYGSGSLHGAAADGAGPGDGGLQYSGVMGMGLKNSTHGAALALFSDVWAADGKGPGVGMAGGGLADGAAAEWRGAAAGQHHQQQHAAWQALAEAQSLQLSQAMEALGTASAASVAGSSSCGATLGSAYATGTHTSGTASLSIDSASGLMPQGTEAAAAGCRSGSPAELEPLPEFPASLFDDDDLHGAALPGGGLGADGVSAHGGPGTSSAAGGGNAGGHHRGTPAGLQTAASGATLPNGPPRRSGSGAGLNAGGSADGPQPPPPPPLGARPMMYPPGSPAMPPGAGGPMGHPQGSGSLPYGHPSGGMYPPAMGPHGSGPYPGSHAAYAAAAAGGVPYGDWYGAATGGAYGGYRQQQPMMVPPGGMYGSHAATQAGMQGPRGGAIPGAGGMQAAGGVGGPYGPGAHPGPGAAAGGPGGGGGSAWFSGSSGSAVVGGAGGGGSGAGGGIKSGSGVSRGGGSEGASVGSGGGGHAGGSGGAASRHSGHHGHGHSRQGAKGRR